MGRHAAGVGGFRKVDMTSLVSNEPERAKREIVDAYRNAGGDLKQAAEQLGVSWRTLYRYVDRLELADALTKVQAKLPRVCPTCRRPL